MCGADLFPGASSSQNFAPPAKYRYCQCLCVSCSSIYSEAASHHNTTGTGRPLTMPGDHPLRSTWVAWEQYDTDGNDYADEMEQIVDFRTVEGFWRFFENFPKMSDILFDGMTKKELRRVVGKGNDQAGAGSTGAAAAATAAAGVPEGNIIRALSVFKKGVPPEWEAPGNKGGGFLALKRLNNLRQLDALYEALAAAVIGGSADPHNVVNGIRVVDKSARGRCNYKLEIWLAGCAKETLEETRLILGDLLQAAVPHSKLALPLGFTRFHPTATAAAATTVPAAAAAAAEPETFSV